ncbi:MAG: hypothetical protein K2O73_01270, partial [Lachnospiraceae bacterium]|nr:hypothetical protein [Lachnospiraceae bacterium]
MKKKRKLWVKLAALTLALALLWMNMADVRNIVNANAEGDDGGDEQITAVVSLDGETVADDGDVTITVTTNHAVGGVMISIGAEDSAPETVDGFASNEDKMIWKKTLSMKEHGWAAGAKVSIFSVTDGDGNLISVESGNCSFTVEEKSVDPDPEEDPFTVTVEGFDDTQPTVKDTVKLTVITSSAADRVEIVLGVEGSDEPIPVEEDSVKDAGDGKTWTVELPVSKYEEWTVGTKVYVSSVTATKDEKTVNGIVSNSEDDESSVSAENAMYSFTVAEEEGNPGEDGNEPDDSKADPDGNDNDS